MAERKRIRLSQADMLDFTAWILNNAGGDDVTIVLKGPDAKVAFSASGDILATVEGSVLVVRHQETTTTIELPCISKISIRSDISFTSYITGYDFTLIEQDGLWEYYTGENQPSLWLVEDDNHETLKTDNIVDLAEYKARKYKK